MAGKMWDDAGASWSRNGQEARQHHHRDHRGGGGALAQGDRAGDRGLDQAGQGQGPRRRQAARAGARAGRQVRQGAARAGAMPLAACGAGSGEWLGPLARMREPCRSSSRPGVDRSRRAARACRAGSRLPHHARRRHHGRGQRRHALAGQRGSIPGDFELVQMATALAVFAFLPLCQAHRGNIIVDTFTTRLPRRVRNALDALLGPRLRRRWRRSSPGGSRSARRRHCAATPTTMMLGLPIGWAIAHLRRAWRRCSLVVALATALRLLRGGR